MKQENIAVVAILSLFFLAGLFIGLFSSTYFYEQKINDCQHDLPRAEHCVLIAVPESKTKEDE